MTEQKSAIYSDILEAVQTRDATVTLNRADATNGYTLATADELEHAFKRVDADPASRVGFLTGAGMSITLSCNIPLGSTDSRFSLPFTRRGIFTEIAPVWQLPRLVGLACAKDWILTGRRFDAQEALDAGLVASLHAPRNIPSSPPDSRLIGRLPSHLDAVEGVGSFLEARPPHFSLTVAKDLPEALPWTGQPSPQEEKAL